MGARNKLFKRCALAALLALGLAVVAAALQGFRTGFSTGTEAVDPSLKATMLAAGISEFLNCTVTFALIGVPVAVLLAYFTGRPPATGAGAETRPPGP